MGDVDFLIFDRNDFLVEISNAKVRLEQVIDCCL